MKTINIISHGVARCKYEPRGDNGLEGYLLNECYLFERAENDTGEYIRVYPDEISDTSANVGTFGYYETCGTGIFGKFFNVVSEQSI